MLENPTEGRRDWFEFANLVLAKKQKINPIDAKVALSNIYAKATTQRELSKTEELFLEVIFRDEENIEPFEQLEDYVEEYYYSQVKKILGLTFKDWMELPVTIKDRLMRVSGRLLANENKQLEAMKNLMEQDE